METTTMTMLYSKGGSASIELIRNVYTNKLHIVLIYLAVLFYLFISKS